MHEDVDAVLADLARWTADARATDAAASRLRERWLRRQAEEEALFAGVLLDLAEHGAGVILRTEAGRMLRGRVATVARDFCVVRHDGGSATLVAFVAIASVRPEPGYPAGEAASDRVAPVDANLADVLAGLADDRPRVRIVLDGGGEHLSGELRAVGADVATVRLDGEGAGRAGGVVYVRLGAVREVTLLG